MNTTFLKIQVLDEFLKEIEDQKKKLVEELLQNASNRVIRTRRVRMLSQLSQYESQTIKKIFDFESNSYSDYFQKDYRREIAEIVNRSS